MEKASPGSLMTIAATCAALSLSRPTVMRLVADRTLTSYKLGKRAVRISRASVERLLEESRRK